MRYGGIIGGKMNIKKLLDTIRCDTDSLYWELMHSLKLLGMEAEYEYDDWIYVNNSSPIMLVAHIDTVSRNTKLKFRVKRDKIKARNSVLGADDRAGVFAIMEILNRCKETGTPMPSVLFTNYEESGLIGVDAFIKAGKMEKNVNLFIELDRKGKDEYVVYDCRLPNEVKEYIESYGFKKNVGSVSDVCNLTEEYKIPHVNLSVGYYNQHSSSEYLVPSELEWTINQVFNMVKNPIEELHEVTDFYDSYSWYGYNDYCYTGSYFARNKNYRNDKYNSSTPITVYYPEDDFKPIQLRYFPVSEYVIVTDYKEDYDDIIWNEEEELEEVSVRDKGIYDYTDEELEDYYGGNYGYY